MKSLRSLLLNRSILSRRNIVIAALLVIGVLLFVSIFDSVQENDNIATLDSPILEWALAHQNPILTTIMRIVTDTFSPIALSALVLVGAAIWVWRTKEYWRPLLVIGSMTLAFVVAAVIKAATARARPSITDLLNHPAAISYSFPSGHVIGVSVLVLVLGYLFCANRPTRRRIITWVITIISITGLVAFSRIYLGYHWLTDVMASIGLALMIVAVVIAVDTYARRRSRPIA